MGGMKDSFFGDNFADTRVYPLAPGFKEPTTSKDAAKRAERTAETVRSEVLRELGIQPMTADEVAAMLDLSILTVRPRVSELRKLALIEPLPGVRRPNESGNSAIVWRVKQ